MYLSVCDCACACVFVYAGVCMSMRVRASVYWVAGGPACLCVSVSGVVGACMRVTISNTFFHSSFFLPFSNVSQKVILQSVVFLNCVSCLHDQRDYLLSPGKNKKHNSHIVFRDINFGTSGVLQQYHNVTKGQ